MKCALALVFSVLLLLPAVIAQQSPINDLKNPVDGQVSTAPSSIPASADAPLAPHADGIYLLSKGPDGSVRLKKLQSKIPEFKHDNGGRVFLKGMATYGFAKSHGQAVLEGSNAELATAETSPVFYAYNQTDGPLKLVKFNVKNHRREINIRAWSAYSSSTGEDPQSLLELRSEQIKPGIQKITPLKPLPAGEYAFQVGLWIPFFDFGIRAGQ
jgi:hypothetical protein